MFLENHPSYTGRPADAERDRLMRDWDRDRRDRLAARWDTVRKTGRTALAIGLTVAAGIGGAELIESGVGRTDAYNQAADGNRPAMVQHQIDQHIVQQEIDKHMSSAPGSAGNAETPAP